MVQKLICTILPLKVMSPGFFDAVPCSIYNNMRESSEKSRQNYTEYFFAEKELLAGVGLNRCHA